MFARNVISHSVSPDENRDMRGGIVCAALLFGANGLAMGAWAGLVPHVLLNTGGNISGFGVAMMFSPLGAIIATPIVSRVIQRAVSAAPLMVAFAFLVASLVTCMFVGSLLWLAGAQFFFGVGSSAFNIVINVVAIGVEDSVHKPVMSQLHGLFSLLAFCGAVMVGGIVQVGGKPWFAMIVAGSLSFVIVIRTAPSASKYLTAPESGRSSHEEDEAVSRPSRRPWGVATLVGLLVVCSWSAESTVDDWSATLIQVGFGGSAGIAPLGFAAFTVSVTFCRLFGSRLVSRVGTRRVVLFGALLGSLSLTVGGLVGSPVLMVVMYCLFGIGVSQLTPLFFGMAGRLPGVPRASGVALANTFGLIGLLAAPAVLGIVAGEFGLNAIALVPATLLIVASIIVSGLCRVLRGRGLGIS